MNPTNKRLYCDGAKVTHEFFGTFSQGKVLDYNSDTDSYLVVHQGRTVWWNASQVTGTAVGFQRGDRVKFRYNGKCGTVFGVNTTGSRVEVHYDHEAYPSWEDASNLDLIFSPAAIAAKGPHPMQPAVDAIEEERRKVVLQIEALQIRCSELKKAKELLLRGV